MTTNPNRRRAVRLKDLQTEKSRKGVEAKRRLMLERAAAWRDVGGLVTDGVLGVHSVRLLASETYGQHRQARTLRGLGRCMAKMIYAKSGGGYR